LFYKMKGGEGLLWGEVRSSSRTVTGGRSWTTGWSCSDCQKGLIFGVEGTNIGRWNIGKSEHSHGKREEWGRTNL